MPATLRPSWAPNHRRRNAGSSGCGRPATTFAPHLLRVLRPAAPRAGIRRHRRQRRPRHPRLQGPRASSARCSTRPRSPRCTATSRSATRATPRRARRPGRTRSPSSRPTAPTRWRSATTATSSTPRSWPSRRGTAGPRHDRLRPRHHAHGERDGGERRARGRGAAGAADAWPGAFCFVMMDERSVYAARDPHGVRPLSHRSPAQRLRRGVGDVRARHRGRGLRARRRAGRARAHRRPWTPLGAVRRVPATSDVHLRVCLPRATRLAPA